ncbi:MAG TPA: hypothetical protein VK064_06440 [Wenzhouxiangella sp.]|nr:hypothetical protein [Wenzhouxiangella sp.]
MPETLKVSVLSAGARERTVMRSLLAIAGSRDDGRGWQVTEEQGGDLTVVDVDSQEGETLWLALRERGKRPVALTARRDFAADRVLRKPLRSRAFLDLLKTFDEPEDQDASQTETQPEIVAENGHQWLSMERPADSGMATLAEHLRRQTWTSPVMLQPSGWPRLIIDPGSGSWFFDGPLSDMKPQMFAQLISADDGHPVSSSDLVAEVESEVRRPLRELKWFAGLAQSRGRLHPDLAGEATFMLTQAPGEAMENDRFAKLARILIRAPMGVDELHRESGEAAENIAAFLNACYTTGQLLVSRQAEVVGY